MLYTRIRYVWTGFCILCLHLHSYSISCLDLAPLAHILGYVTCTLPPFPFVSSSFFFPSLCLAFFSIFLFTLFSLLSAMYMLLLVFTWLSKSKHNLDLNFLPRALSLPTTTVLLSYCCYCLSSCYCFYWGPINMVCQSLHGIHSCLVSIRTCRMLMNTYEIV